MTSDQELRPRPTPPWLYLVLLAMAAVTAFLIWRAHPASWVEVGDIVLAGLILEVAGLILAAPIGLITGAYRKRPRDYGAPRRRPFGVVALGVIVLSGGLYLLANNLLWIPFLSSPEIWKYPPWDARWTSFWIKQGAGTGVYFGLFLGSAVLQAVWDDLDRRHWRKLAQARPKPVMLQAD